MKIALLSILLVLLAPAASALAAADQEATIQDDETFIYTTPAKRMKALDEAAALGVDRIRVTVLWAAVAPDPLKRKRPAGFVASDPASYAPGVWTNYDLLVREAAERGIRVNFNLTGPSPYWANKKPPRPDIKDNFEPSPKEFFQFVGAVAKRYSGNYTDAAYDTPLPRVNYWSIWNEPNHSGWLTPTWDKRQGKFVERSASLYRELLGAAWQALALTGHGKDTIIFGETAPAGNDSMDLKRFMKPATFIRALYCVDDKLKRLRGKAAKRLDCESSTRKFAAVNPALFKATGYAHHPYQLLTAPSVKPSDDGIITIAVIDRLEKMLDKIQRRYGKTKRFPIYLTEFGYQSKPDPVGVSLRRQAAFINESEYIASRDKRVRTMSQFLLRDGGEPIGLTFQSGLRTRKGKRKPAYAAYRVPVWLTGKGAKRKVWGLVRPAEPGARVKALIQTQAEGGKFKTVKTVRTRGEANTVRATVRVPAGGKLRIKSGALTSRAAPVD